MEIQPSSRGSRPRRTQLLAAQWVLGGAVLGSVMALGAVHTLVLICVTAALAAALALGWGGAEPTQVRSVAGVLVWTGVGLTLYTLLQATPMPASWLARVSPASADIWARCLSPLHAAGPAWATISLDPVATRVQVLRGVAYLLAFVTALRIAGRREGVAFLEGALIATGLALAVATWVHPALGADKVFGLYRPLRDPGARHMAPIVNSNVLSGYLNVSLCLLFAQTLAPRPRVPRVVAGALVAFLVATQLWVASRGGMVAGSCGLIVVIWMTRSARVAGQSPRASLVLLFALFLAAVGMAVLAASEASWVELADADVSKLSLAVQAIRMVPSFPLGIGRGAFESVFPAFRTGISHLVFTHPENIVAQWGAEWGGAVSAIAAAAILFALRPSSALARSYSATGAWAALVCLGIHNLVDFSSEFPAVVIALAVCAALVTAGSRGGDGGAGRSGSWAKSPGLVAATGVVIAVLAILLVLPGQGHELREDRAEALNGALDPQMPPARFTDDLRAAMLRHPAEPYLPYVGGLRAWETHEGSVIPWMERTLERAPVYGPAHLLLARSFRATSAAQSRLEYRIALEQAPELAGTVIKEILPLVRSYDDALELSPEGDGRAGWLILFLGSVKPRLPATSARLDEDLLRLKPGSPESLARHAEEGLADLRDREAASWCDGASRPTCVSAALAAATSLEQVTPTLCKGYLLRAQIRLESGEAVPAVNDLLRDVAQVTDRAACLKEAVGLASSAGMDEAVTAALDSITRAGCLDPPQCVANLRFVATHEEARGNLRRALAALERASERMPEDETLMVDTARLASRLDLHAQALGVYERLARQHPTEARWVAAMEAERGAVVRDSIQN